MTALDQTVVLFDWNGTIVLDADRARGSLNRVLGSRGLSELNHDEFSERFRLPMRGLLGDLGIGESDLVQSEADWNEGMLGAGPVAREGASTGLVSLATAGARIGIVSAASPASIAADLDVLALPVRWDLVRGSVADKAAVLRDERDASVDAFYVGDTVYDIECALAAGFRAVGVSGGYTAPSRLVDAGAEWIISSFAELPGLMGVEIGVVSPQPGS